MMFGSAAVMVPPEQTTSWTGVLANALDLTAEGLVGLTVIAVFAGLLIPRWVYMQLVREIEYLRTAIKEERENRVKATDTAIKALAAVEQFKRVLDSLKPEGGAEDEVAVHKE